MSVDRFEDRSRYPLERQTVVKQKDKNEKRPRVNVQFCEHVEVHYYIWLFAYFFFLKKRKKEMNPVISLHSLLNIYIPFLAPGSSAVKI